MGKVRGRLCLVFGVGFKWTQQLGSPKRYVWTKQWSPFPRWHGQAKETAMGQSLWLHFGVDEHPFATCFDVHQGVPGF